jgi:hypothetical protein
MDEDRWSVELQKHSANHMTETSETLQKDLAVPTLKCLIHGNKMLDDHIKLNDRKYEDVGIL